MNVRTLLLASILTASLTGCEGSGPFAWQPETPAERELRLSREALQRTIGEGSNFGILALGALGAAVGGGEGAFRGAQVGMTVGAAAGSYVSDIQREYAEQEAALNAVIEDIRLVNERLEASIIAARAARDEARVEASAARSRIERDIVLVANVAERQSEMFGQARDLLGQNASAASLSGVDQELERLRSRVAIMRDIADEFQ